MEDLLASRFNKDEVVLMVNSNPGKFRETVNIALAEDKNKISWRAAWVLYHCCYDNDKRLLPYLERIINNISSFEDSRQREFLRILSKFDMTDKYEGLLFDKCLSIWENPNKSSGVRHIAFKNIVNIIKKYPDLTTELQPLLEHHYLENLSPGIKHSISKIIAEMQVQY